MNIKRDHAQLKRAWLFLWERGESKVPTWEMIDMLWEINDIRWMVIDNFQEMIDICREMIDNFARQMKRAIPSCKSLGMTLSPYSNAGMAVSS